MVLVLGLMQGRRRVKGLGLRQEELGLGGLGAGGGVLQ